MSPHWRTGKYSRYLPARLAQRYTEAAGDPDLVSLRHELALVDARMSELLEQLGHRTPTAAADAWREAQAALTALRAARRKRDGAAAQDAAMATLAQCLSQGVATAATWDDIAKLTELRARLVDSEAKRLKDLHQMISVERVLVLIGQLSAAVKAHVTDPQALAAISQQFLRLTAGGTGSTAE